jgi:predicted exporter
MSRKAIYFLLFLVGAVVPYSAFVPWLIEHGLDVPRMVDDLFANRVSAFFGLDVIVSAVVLWVFIAFERQRTVVRHTWVPIAASLAIGVSAGLPLFLYLRESALGKDGVVKVD